MPGGVRICWAHSKLRHAGRCKNRCSSVGFYFWAFDDGNKPEYTVLGVGKWANVINQ